jgi:hypothetical protein
MMNLYKDESLRYSLIAAGNLQAEKFSWDKAADERCGRNLWKLQVIR